MVLLALSAAGADANTVQVVEAGSALFPDRAYVLTLPSSQKVVLTTDDVTVTEDGKPVKNLSVLSSASAIGNRNRSPDRLLQQHEGVDPGRDAGCEGVRGPEPGPATLGRLLQQQAERSPCR